MESPREFRLQPRDRLVAYTSEAAGARQLFVLPLRGGYPVQLTASEKNVADPQWSPDGRRLAYVRDNEIRVIDADGMLLTKGWFDFGAFVGDPGLEHKEDIDSLEASAVAGGFTDVAVLPNTSPSLQSKNEVSYVTRGN